MLVLNRNGGKLDYQALMEGDRRFQKLPKFDDAYKEHILNKRQIWENLSQLTPQDARNTIIEFLKAWKIRYTERIKPIKLKEKLRKLNAHFQVFRNECLIALDFDREVTLNNQRMKISEVIKEIYRELCGKKDKKIEIKGIKGIGPTAASKILHGVNPQVFMMWDEAIRNGYGYAGNEVGYLKFMIETREILLRMASHLREADKSSTKLLDEYNYMKFTRGEDLPDPF